MREITWYLTKGLMCFFRKRGSAGRGRGFGGLLCQSTLSLNLPYTLRLLRFDCIRLNTSVKQRKEI